MTPQQQVMWEADQRSAGSHRIICPWCKGGAGGERSLALTISTNGNVHYRCFRASCGEFGGTYEKPTTVKEPTYFTAETVTLSEEREQWFRDKFGFVPSNTKYATKLDRYVYTVRGPENQVRGYIARSFSGATPKALPYIERPDEPFIGWSRGGDDYLVLVEDWLSAEKVSECGIATSVSLNGVYLNADSLQDVHDAMPRAKLILALDRDAFGNAIRYAGTFGRSVTPPLRVWRLEADLKYESIDRITKALVDGTDNFSSHS